MKDYQMLNLLGQSQTDLYISHWTLSRLFGAHSHHNEYICKVPTLKKYEFAFFDCGFDFSLLWHRPS